MSPGQRKYNNNKRYVSASDMGQAAYCPHALSLRKNGVRVDRHSYARMKEGSRSHHQLNEVVISNSKRQPKRKSACYIATYAYGEHHPVTEDLRSWRDEKLLNSWTGRVFVHVYYKVSPIAVIVAKRSPLLTKFLRLLVDGVHKRL